MRKCLCAVLFSLHVAISTVFPESFDPPANDVAIEDLVSDRSLAELVLWVRRVRVSHPDSSCLYPFTG